MSDEKIQDLESLLKKLIGLGWTSLVTVIAGAFTIGAWVSSLEIRAQDTSVRLTRADATISNLDAFRIAAEANSERIGDAIRASSALQNYAVSNDKRITRLEDSFLNFSKTLERIDKNIAAK